MKMYDDLKTPAPVDTITHKVHLQEKLLKVMENTLENNEYSAKEVTDLFNGALDAIRHISDYAICSQRAGECCFPCPLSYTNAIITLPVPL